MRKWVRIERADTGDGFFVLTGYNENIASTIFIPDLSTVSSRVREYFEELPPVSIDVKEGPIGVQERAK